MTIIHHVSIINRKAETSFDFYRHVLGLALLMKTVNQDDNNMYHLFFSDKEGRPGSEVTIFEMKDGQDKSFGTNMIERLMLKVPSEASLHFWMERFDSMDICHYGIEQYNGRSILRFEGPDQTYLGFAAKHDDDSIEDYHPADSKDIPAQHRILAIDSIHLRTRYAAATVKELIHYHDFNMTKEGKFIDSSLPVFILSNNDPLFHHEIHVIQDNHLNDGIEGIGSIHHIALSTGSLNQLNELHDQLEQRHFRQSPVKNREFFQSLYYRDPNHLLIEVATMGHHITEQANKTADYFNDIPLLLPKFLEHKRDIIEQELLKKNI